MKKDRLITLLVLVAASLLAALPVLADTPARPPVAGRFVSGSYCVSCHTPGDERLSTVLEWSGGIERESIGLCAAAAQVREDIYYTERILLAIDNARAGLPARASIGKAETQLAAARETYSRMLDTPVNSLNAVVSEGQTLRYRLGKVYTRLNQAGEAVKRQNVLIVAVVVTLVLGVALVWGLVNINRFSIKGGGSDYKMPGWKTGLFVLGVFVLFALPIFRVPAQTIDSADEDALARQASLDSANRAAEAVDRALARSWMLARVGAEWAETNPQQAQQALDEALAAAEEIRAQGQALWGETHAVLEGTVGSPAAQEKAVLAASRLTANSQRVWNLRLIAAEWAKVDPARAEEILNTALRLTTGQSGLYRELDVRGIAVTWAAIDPAKGLAVTDRIYDPAIRSWALREIAALTGDGSLYTQAAEAARQVDSPLYQARLLALVAASSGQTAFFEEAVSLLEQVDNPARAYALAELAAASGNGSLVEQIDRAYPAARAYALYRLAQYDAAWTETEAIPDAIERARAQAAIAAAWGNVEAANRITDPTLRARALRDIAVSRQDAALAGNIDSPYYRVQALTRLELYPQAVEAAAELRDPYPLRELVARWAAVDPHAARAVVDMLTREADRAEAMRAIAAATGDESDVERALNLALAARIRGDALAPAEASLALAKSLVSLDTGQAEAAFTQAYTTAVGISTRY